MQQILERVDDGSTWPVLLRWLSQSTGGNWVEPNKSNVFRNGHSEYKGYDEFPNDTRLSQAMTLILWLQSMLC